MQRIFFVWKSKDSERKQRKLSTCFFLQIFDIDSLSKNSKVSLFGIKMSFYHAEAICKYVCVCVFVCVNVFVSAVVYLYSRDLNGIMYVYR